MRVSFRSLIERGTKFIGTYMMHACDTELEILQMAGYDFVILDLEHERLTFSEIASMIRTCDACGLATMIRVPGIDEAAIKKALDIGASAIKVPGVSTAAQAREVVSYAKYPPQGQRGACPSVRANGYGIDQSGCYEKANREVVVSVIIESPEGISNMEEIIAVPGVDTVSVGNVDLSVALGIPGQRYHPRVIEAVLDCARLCIKYGKTCSAQVRDAEDAKTFKACPGISHYHSPMSIYLLYQAAKRLCDGLRDISVNAQ